MTKVKNLLETIGYVGFSNFDIKYDIRDNRYKFFEINTRQGRSNYYVTGSGFNVARYCVEECYIIKTFRLKSQKMNTSGWSFRRPLPANMYISRKTKKN